MPSPPLGMENVCILLYPQHPPLKTYSTGLYPAHTALGSHIFIRYAPQRYWHICNLPPKCRFGVVEPCRLCDMRRQQRTSRVGHELTWRYAATWIGKASEPIRYLKSSDRRSGDVVEAARQMMALEPDSPA